MKNILCYRAINCAIALLQKENQQRKKVHTQKTHINRLPVWCVCVSKRDQDRFAMKNRFRLRCTITSNPFLLIYVFVKLYRNAIQMISIMAAISIRAPTKHTHTLISHIAVLRHTGWFMKCRPCWSLLIDLKNHKYVFSTQIPTKMHDNGHWWCTIYFYLFHTVSTQFDCFFLCFIHPVHTNSYQ